MAMLATPTLQRVLRPLRLPAIWSPVTRTPRNPSTSSHGRGRLPGHAGSRSRAGDQATGKAPACVVGGDASSGVTSNAGVELTRSFAKCERVKASTGVASRDPRSLCPSRGTGLAERGRGEREDSAERRENRRKRTRLFHLATGSVEVVGAARCRARAARSWTYVHNNNISFYLSLQIR